MASSVFFRFKSQKEPTRVTFDGTGISVFELKREIITLNRLGDGTDFELIISSEDTGEGKRYSALQNVVQGPTEISVQSTMMIHNRSHVRLQSLRRDYLPSNLVAEVPHVMCRGKCRRTQRTCIGQMSPLEARHPRFKP